MFNDFDSLIFKWLRLDMFRLDSRLPRVAISSTAGSSLFRCLRLRMFFRLGRRLMLQILRHRAFPGHFRRDRNILQWIKVLKVVKHPK